MGMKLHLPISALFFICLSMSSWLSATSLKEEHDLIPQKIHEFGLNDIAYEPSKGLTFATLSYDCVILWEINTCRQIRVFPGMGKGFTSLAFTPDGKYLAAGAKDASIVFWETATGKIVKVFLGHTLGVRDIAISPNGKLLASVGSSWGPKPSSQGAEGDEGDGKTTSEADNLINGVSDVLEMNWVKKSELKVWDIASSKVISKDPAYFGALAPLAFSPDGLTLASGGIDFTMALWDVETGQMKARPFKFNQRLQAVAFSPDGAHLISAIWGKDANQFPARGLLLWDIKNQTVRHNFKNYTGFVEDLAFSPDGQFVTSVANDFNAFLPEEYRRSMKPIPLSDDTSYTGKLEPFEKFRWKRNRMRAKQANGRYKVMSHSEAKLNLGELKLWRVADGSTVHRHRDSSPIFTVDYSPQGKHLVADSLGGTIRLWRTRDFEPVQEFQGLAADIMDVVYSPDGRYVGNLDGGKHVRIWDVGNIRSVRLLQGHKDRVNAVAFSIDSKKVATASKDKTIKLWDIATGELEYSFALDREPRALAFSPDGKHLVSLDWPDLFKRSLLNKKLSWWNLVTKKRTHFGKKDGRWDIGKEKFNRIRFSADGASLLLSAGYRRLGSYEFASEAPTDVKEVATGETIYRYDTSDAADYSSSGRYVVTAKGVAITLYETKNRAVLQQFKGHQYWTGLRSTFKQALGVTSVAISPDEKYVLSCATDRTMRLWDIKSGRQVCKLDGPFQLASFSPDGRSILSAHSDGRFQIWDTAKLAEQPSKPVQPAVTLIGLANSEEFIAFTPDLFYKSTRNGYRAVVVLKKGKAYNFDQFDLLLNRPDKVVAAFPNPDSHLISLFGGVYQKRLRSMNLKEGDLTLDFDIPVVQINNDSSIRKVTDDELLLDISSRDDKTQLDRLMIWVNGVPVAGQNGIDLSKRQVSQVHEKRPIPLGWGENYIEVSALNAKGAESYRQSLLITRDGTAPKPNLYVLSLGVSKYSFGKGEKNLDFAAKDASDLKASLEKLDAYFGEIKVHLLRDSEVTKAGILQERRFLQEARVDDVVLVFMAGHGLLDVNQTFYFGTADVNFQTPSEGGFAFSEIEGLMDGLTCRHKLVMIDACFSGAIDPDLLQNTASSVPDQQSSSTGSGGPSVGNDDGETRGFGGTANITSEENPAYHNTFDLMRETFVDLNRGSGTFVLAAAQGNEFAYETSNLQNGIFTHALLEGLSTVKKAKNVQADLNKDGALTVTELRDYVASRVKKLSEGKQTPASRKETLNYDFALLSPEEKKLGIFGKAKKFAQKGLDQLTKSLSGELWLDTDKPRQFWGELGMREGASNLVIGKPRPPAKGYFPLPLEEFTEKQRRKVKPREAKKLPYTFESQLSGRNSKNKEAANWVFRFQRRDDRKGDLFVTQTQGKKTMEELVKNTLDFKFSHYAPTHKAFLKRDRNNIVLQEESVLHGRNVTFLVTQSTNDAAEGSLHRIYYHLLYCGPNFTLRLTTAGGHEADRKDVNSYEYSPDFSAAVRALLQRFRFGSE